MLFVSFAIALIPMLNSGWRQAPQTQSDVAISIIQQYDRIVTHGITLDDHAELYHDLFDAIVDECDTKIDAGETVTCMAHVTKVNTARRIDYFLAACILFVHERIHHVSIDFEFHKHIIALGQICFTTDDHGMFVFIYDPSMLDEEQHGMLINCIYTSQHATRIMHGANTLDQPYLYNVLFDSNHDMILAFTRNFIDTRYLCEYIKLATNQGNKCSLYVALLYFGIISQDMFDALDAQYESMGPIYKVIWNIKRMNTSLTSYVSHDVIHLRRFADTLLQQSHATTHVSAINRLVAYDRYYITSVIARTKKLVEAQVVKLNNQNRKHEQSFTEYFVALMSSSHVHEYNVLLRINDFHRVMNVLYKYIALQLYVMRNDRRSKQEITQRANDVIDDIAPLLERVFLDDVTSLLRSFAICAIA